MSAAGLGVVLLVFAIAWIGTGLVRRVALRSGLLDHPGERSSHTQPTPRGGGLAIVIAFFAALAWLLLAGELPYPVAAAVAFGGLAVAGIGFIDDRYSAPARLRLLVHLAAATGAVAAIGAVTFGAGPAAAWESWLARGFTVIAIVWAINLFNFMDGIDGIAGSEAFFLAAAGAALNWYVGGDRGLTAAMACMAAANAGFLAWNWPPASIFMGDVGSGFLGFTLSALGLSGVKGAALPMEVWPILGGVFLVDATVTLVRRVADGHRWHEAHRMHAYQHLSRRFRAHLPVTLAVSAINVCWLLPWAVGAALQPAHAPMFMAAALIPLAVLAVALEAGKP
jgi:Fuc2NAc and GlcNAc transferase